MLTRLLTRCYLGGFGGCWAIRFAALQVEAFNIVNPGKRVPCLSLDVDKLLYFFRSYQLLCESGVMCGPICLGSPLGPLIVVNWNLFQASLLLEWVYMR